MQQVPLKASEDDEVDAFPAAGKQHDIAHVDRLDDTHDDIAGILAHHVVPDGDNPNAARQQALHRFRALREAR